MNNEKINEDIYYTKMKKNKIIGLIIFAIIVLGIILINPIQKQIAKISLSKDIQKEVLKDVDYEKYNIEGKYFNNLNIQMKNDFENYEYSKKKEIASELLKKFNKVFKKYEGVLIDKDTTDYIQDKVKEITEAKVIINCKDNKYTIFGGFAKNDEEYTEEASLKEDIIQQLNNNNIDNKDEILKILQSTKYSKETLENILNLQDVKEKTNEIIYRTAIINDDSYKKEIELLEKIPEYKDSKELISKINKAHELDGEWAGSGYKWIINGEKCYRIYSNYSYKYTYDQYYSKYENNILYIFDNESQMDNLDTAIYKLKQENGKLLYSPYSSSQSTIELSKLSDKTQPEDKVKLLEPSIGMTKTEVENSTWGKPNKINRTTTSYGKHEQWCYNNYKYIYFEDGIVTSIQD